MGVDLLAGENWLAGMWPHKPSGQAPRRIPKTKERRGSKGKEGLSRALFLPGVQAHLLGHEGLPAQACMVW